MAYKGNAGELRLWSYFSWERTGTMHRIVEIRNKGNLFFGVYHFNGKEHLIRLGFDIKVWIH